MDPEEAESLVGHPAHDRPVSRHLLDATLIGVDRDARRERIATAVFSVLVAHNAGWPNSRGSHIAGEAVVWADALIAALEETPCPPTPTAKTGTTPGGSSA